MSPSRKSSLRGGGFDCPADAPDADEPDLLARLAAIGTTPEPLTEAQAEAWYAELEARYGNRQMPLDAETILNAYEARYGKEADRWEREYLGTMGDASLCRLHILAEALRSAVWTDGMRPGHQTGH
jgi:hypothetical protein